jgi:uncharacterized protein (DUF488 family)
LHCGIANPGDHLKKGKGKRKTVIFTIGHSTRSIEEFIAILEAFSIERVVDVRTIPKSRHNPQFNDNALRAGLKEKHIEYLHMKGLGGLRHEKKDSPNVAWRNASFRGFADYMQTENFEESLERLMLAAAKKTTTIMCAEAVPWRCHRSLIADALLVRGLDVRHIMTVTSDREHTMTPWAKVSGKKITYPDAISVAR